MNKYITLIVLCALSVSCKKVNLNDPDILMFGKPSDSKKTLLVKNAGDFRTVSDSADFILHSQEILNTVAITSLTTNFLIRTDSIRIRPLLKKFTNQSGNVRELYLKSYDKNLKQIDELLLARYENGNSCDGSLLKDYSFSTKCANDKVTGKISNTGKFVFD